MVPTTHILGRAFGRQTTSRAWVPLTCWIDAALLPPADAVSHAKRTAADAADKVCVLAAILDLRPGHSLSGLEVAEAPVSLAESVCSAAPPRKSLVSVQPPAAGCKALCRQAIIA